MYKNHATRWLLSTGREHEWFEKIHRISRASKALVDCAAALEANTEYGRLLSKNKA